MKFKNFTFKLTDDCNFNCSYCRQKKEPNYIESSTIQRALEFFSPYLEDDAFVNFYGGEPLLAFPLSREIVHLLQKHAKNRKKSFRFTISTNASLMDDEILQFLIHNYISPLISFDGYAQENSRKRGTFQPTIAVIENLQSSNLEFIVNSVFTPTTINHLFSTMKFLIQQGVPKIRLSLSTDKPWNETALAQLNDELIRLRQLLLAHFKLTNSIPVDKFSAPLQKGIFVCVAGRERMALTPDGKLWGCHVFANYFNQFENSSEFGKYCFGYLDHFIENHVSVYQEVLHNLSFLRMENFSKPSETCESCTELEECRVCPVYSALATGVIGLIPDWLCRIRKIFRKENHLLQQELGLPL